MYWFNYNHGEKDDPSCSVDNTNATLDDMVARISQWHVTKGYREHKPRFYDYDKQRWIVLKKWKPTGGIVKKKMPPN